jgi:hypothetical protein
MKEGGNEEVENKNWRAKRSELEEKYKENMDGREKREVTRLPIIVIEYYNNNYYY